VYCLLSEGNRVVCASVNLTEGRVEIEFQQTIRVDLLNLTTPHPTESKKASACESAVSRTTITEEEELFWPTDPGCITSTPKSVNFSKKHEKWPKYERDFCIPVAKNAERPYLAS